MYVRLAMLAIFAGPLLFSAGGCKKSEPAPGSAPPPASSGQLLARVHWLGKKRLSTEPTATNLMQIWNRPESARLESQTLNKLSTAPWRLLLHQSETNPASALLRPILEDLVQAESYLEVRQQTNKPGALVLAVQVGQARCSLWKTNLGEVLKSLTGIPPVNSADGLGWSLKKHHPPDFLQFRSAGGWALFAGGEERNPLLEDVTARIQRDRSPVAAGATNFWLETDCDLTRVARAFLRGWIPPEGFPLVSLSIIGDGEKVRTRGLLTFGQTLDLKLKPWVIPTNTVHDPLVSFVALQGVEKLWEKLGSSLNMGFKPVPDQTYVWAMAQIPFQTFVALEVIDPTNFIQSIAPQVSAWGAKIGTNMGSLVVATNPWSMVWTGMPFATPYLRPVADAGRLYVLGGIFPNALGTNLVPAELLQTIVGRTNLVFYDWEITQYRLLQWRYLDDIFHIVWDPTHKPRLRSDMASLRWIGNIATNLGNSVTEISVAGTNTLSVVRNSSIGLTGIELETLANWLESAEFPGLPRSLSRTNQLNPGRVPPR
jgi:hypothetical protein